MKLSHMSLARPGLWVGLALVGALTGAAIAAEPGVVRIPNQIPAGTVEPVIFHPFRQNVPHYYDGWGHGGQCECGRCRHGLANGAAFIRPPANWPLHRVPNKYNYYWSAEMGGAPRGHYQQLPMVYQPTDTTQLGFYYTTSPRWRARPEMLPPAPMPHWPLGMHRSWTGYGYGHYGHGYVTGETVADPQPADANGVLVPQPETGKVPPPPVVVP